MKLAIKITLALLIAAIIYSMVPVAVLYLKKDAKSYTNEDAVKTFAGNKGDYFAFIVFGDNHGGFPLTDSAMLKIIGRVNREGRFRKIPVDFVANMGDVAFYWGSEWEYRVYNKLRAMIKWPVISVAGNHDDAKNGDLARFHKYAGMSEFSFADRNSYFIVIDNRGNNINAAQFTWIESELDKASAYKHRFVFMHKPPLSLYQQSWFRPELSPWSKRFMKLCEKHKVDIVFAGHEHLFKEGSYGGVKYIISGGAGMLTQVPDSEGGFLHYIVVRVYDDYVDYEVRKVFPPLWEFFSYYMWKSALYFLKNIFY